MKRVNGLWLMMNSNRSKNGDLIENLFFFVGYCLGYLCRFVIRFFFVNVIRVG